MRFIDAVPDADTVYVSVKRAIIAGNRTYGSVSDYTDVPSGDYAVEASADRDGKPAYKLPSVPFTLVPEHKYIGIATGSIGVWPRANLQIFASDPPQNIPGDEAQLRVIDAYPHEMKLDVIFNNIVAFHGVSFNTRTAPVNIQAKEYVGKLLEAGTYDNPLAGPMPIKLEGGKSYELVLLGPPTPTSPGMYLIEDD